MKKAIHKVMLCATTMLTAYFTQAENYEVVSNQTNALFASTDAGSLKPIDQIYAHRNAAALLNGAHSLFYSDNSLVGITTNKLLGTWSADDNPAIQIIDIVISDAVVTIITKECFLIYTNQSSNCKYVYEFGDYARSYQYAQLVSGNANIMTWQECEPPAPWTTRGVYSPYCKSQMTNRIERIDAHRGISRKIIGYYDADGDGYATLTRVGIVHSDNGDYLDEMADGPYWMMNDVAVVEYTIPRQSYLNYVYGQEDAVNHYWQAIKAFYKVSLPTTPLQPWWKMPEYQ